MQREDTAGRKHGSMLGFLADPFRRLPAAWSPLAVLVALCFLHVPLGQPDYLVYRYSPLVLPRLLRSLPALLISAAAVFLLHRLPRTTGWQRRLVGAGLAACGTAMIAWTFVAPPEFVSQHIFNLQSPAQDGAFVWEVEHVTSVREYLSRTFYQRLQLEPEQMRGTRVLSNPPGMTLLAAGAHRWLQAWPGLAAAVDALMDWSQGEHDDWPDDFRTALVFAVMLTLLWGLSLPVAYGLARLWLPVIPALTIAVGCVWNPSTLNFTPGKDPAQLFFVLLLLYTGLAAYLRRRALPAVLCGVVFGAALTVGLVHAWIVLILLVGTGWHAWRVRHELRRWVGTNVLPAALGLAAAGVLLYVLLDFNVLRAGVAVARRYPQIQKYLIHGAYTFVGFPVFLLFAGPVFWALLAHFRPKAAAEDEVQRLGAHLSRAAAVCMAYGYFFANNNEIARLWMPFLALLTVSMSMRRRSLLAGEVEPAAAGGPLGRPRRQRGPAASPPAAGEWMALMLLALHLLLTVVHWSLMDARESEYRMLSGRHWW